MEQQMTAMRSNRKRAQSSPGSATDGAVTPAPNLKRSRYEGLTIPLPPRRLPAEGFPQKARPTQRPGRPSPAPSSGQVARPSTAAKSGTPSAPPSAKSPPTNGSTPKPMNFTPGVGKGKGVSLPPRLPPAQNEMYCFPPPPPVANPVPAGVRSPCVPSTPDAVHHVQRSPVPPSIPPLPPSTSHGQGNQSQQASPIKVEVAQTVAPPTVIRSAEASDASPPAPVSNGNPAQA